MLSDENGEESEEIEADGIPQADLEQVEDAPEEVIPDPEVEEEE
jgi:hypothetical protein